LIRGKRGNRHNIVDIEKGKGDRSKEKKGIYLTQQLIERGGREKISGWSGLPAHFPSEGEGQLYYLFKKGEGKRRDSVHSGKIGQEKIMAGELSGRPAHRPFCTLLAIEEKKANNPYQGLMGGGGEETYRDACIKAHEKCWKGDLLPPFGISGRG